MNHNVLASRKGKILDNPATLASYGVEDDDLIVVMVSKKPLVRSVSAPAANIAPAPAALAEASPADADAADVEVDGEDDNDDDDEVYHDRYGVEGDIENLDVIILPNGCEYAGDVIDGRAFGAGSCTYADGSEYQGTLLYISINCDVFVISIVVFAGEWVDNQRSGSGSMLFADGREYCGDVRCR